MLLASSFSPRRCFASFPEVQGISQKQMGECQLQRAVLCTATQHQHRDEGLGAASMLLCPWSTDPSCDGECQRPGELWWLGRLTLHSITMMKAKLCVLKLSFGKCDSWKHSILWLHWLEVLYNPGDASETILQSPAGQISCIPVHAQRWEGETSTDGELTAVPCFVRDPRSSWASCVCNGIFSFILHREPVFFSTNAMES